jgi:electron transfer flavoprotein alpha subunit
MLLRSRGADATVELRRNRFTGNSTQIMGKKIVVIGEHFEGEIQPVTLETVGFALRLRQALEPLTVIGIILGEEVEGMAGEMARMSGLDVVAVQVPGLTSYHGEVYREVLENLLPELGASYLCAGHTSQGWDFSPGLAARLGAACITAVEGMEVEAGRILFRRACYGGKIVSITASARETTVLTVQPGSGAARGLRPSKAGSVHFRSVPRPTCATRSLGVKLTHPKDMNLVEADVIVSAGRGIGKKENLDFISRLAALFPKSAVGASRSVCDQGWLEYEHQVGLTGATVAPRLYIACGISGASQHVSGMRGAEWVVAVNTDPHASIFNVADICIEEDLRTFIPTLIEVYEQTREKGRGDRGDR